MAEKNKCKGFLVPVARVYSCTICSVIIRDQQRIVGYRRKSTAGELVPCENFIVGRYNRIRRVSKSQGKVNKKR